jgi:hydroxypyruvate isomerase
VTYQLAASAEMLFLDLEFVDRVAEIHRRGFQVEIWDWTTKNLGEIAATGAKISSMTGYISGDLITKAGSDELLRTAALALEAAKVIDSPRLNLHGTGLDSNGIPVIPGEEVTSADWIKAVDTLKRIAELGAKHERVFVLENLNTAVDHAGTPFAKAADTLKLVKAVNSPNLRLNLDLYHAQIGEGNLVSLINECFDWIGEIQVADVPGRMEPGTGEIYYPRIAQELKSLGYTGVVGLEGFARGDSEAALDQFRALLTPQ